MYNTSLSVGPSRFSEGGNISLGRYQNGELAVVVVHPNTGERQSVATGHRTPVRSSFYRPRPIISGSRAGARTRVSPKRSSGRDPQRLRNPRPVWITMQSVTGLFFLVAVILYLWKEVDNEQL